MYEMIAYINISTVGAHCVAAEKAFVNEQNPSRFAEDLSSSFPIHVESLIFSTVKFDNKNRDPFFLDSLMVILNLFYQITVVKIG